MMAFRLALGVSCAGLLLVAVIALAGCQSCRGEQTSSEPPPAPDTVAGLDAVPRDVQVVLCANLDDLRESWLVRRAVEQMFRRDPELEVRFRQLIDTCQIDPAVDVDRVIVALSRSSGTDETIMVVTGQFSEAELASCMSQAMAAAGGAFTYDRVDGRTFYHASGRQHIWFTVPGPQTVVLATSPEWLARAVGDGEKITSSNEMSALLERVDQRAGLWAVGSIDERIGAGLVELTAGQVTSPPGSVFVEIHPKAGLQVSLGAEMNSKKDANGLELLIKNQMSVGAWALQGRGLGALAKKLRVYLEDKTVYLRLSLTEEELKEVLSRIDTTGGSAQDPPQPEE
ncbi:MAG: hypothetical protein MJE77_19935 [Proteobacteria bacterium]|nr:hypothetical protein [Pseudomonadota bacterium]